VEYVAHLIIHVQNLTFGVVKAGGKPHKIPWKEISQDRNRHILSQEYLPSSDFLMNDPSRMNERSIQALLNHWYRRKQNLEMPFEFPPQGIVSDKGETEILAFSFDNCFEGLEL
jgi:hypothetical protein